MNTNIFQLDQFPLIPYSAFLYFPTCYLYLKQELQNIFFLIIIDKDQKIGNEKNAIRYIFEGHINLDYFEIEQLSILNNEINKQNICLMDWWTESRKLRFLYANQFNIKNTISYMQLHQQWRIQNIPPQLNDDTYQILQSGLFYVHGRDMKFRPIIVLNIQRFDLKNIKINQILDSMTYFFEFIIKNLLLQGQVKQKNNVWIFIIQQIENWIVIIDLKSIGLNSLVLYLKQIMQYLSQNYRSRLFASYVVNSPSSIYFPYQIVKSFLHENTINKIRFYNNNLPTPLFEHSNPSQIETTYGGKAEPLINNFWFFFFFIILFTQGLCLIFLIYFRPPRIISNQYQENNIITEEEYYNQYQNNKLEQNIILKDIIDKFQEKNIQVDYQKNQIENQEVQENKKDNQQQKTQSQFQEVFQQNNSELNEGNIYLFFQNKYQQ
ncbi:hypothetical protein IMG5_122180 [Ichthyophthirius multifiliis]|uniref:CRAL-TRIO domain-containing protein n=1 Tax=Ichthyophthirius multifiliis TaxID=5932 RepID=G0QV94_ICHMU|nr:hypothetical protein IMG5_122180 [Ichthyophthirius multifiliis]EGR30861.1 hypothetical protein IMG5_122180 [Ichthyophthirius multifiliis]|eukprot:XP_004032448.1 hypothetical protein IMG5_122180 [Ichthyophthirius multifiliis]